ncbi:MAG: hypothetical protein WEA80_00610 [Gemmatimonadaceae bacterium]
MLASRSHESSLTVYELDNLRTIANDSSSIARHLGDISRELSAIRAAVESDKRDREFARPLYLMAIGTGTLVLSILYRLS